MIVKEEKIGYFCIVYIYVVYMLCNEFMIMIIVINKYFIYSVKCL